MRTNFFANGSVWMMAALVLLSGMRAGYSEISALIENIAFAEADQFLAVVSEEGGVAACVANLKTMRVERVWQGPVENAGLTAGSDAECFALSYIDENARVHWVGGVKTDAGYRVAPIAESAGADAWVVRVYPERKAALLSYWGRGDRHGYSWWSLIDSREMGSVPAKLKKAVPVSASPIFGPGWILIHERTSGLRKKSHLRLLTAEPFAEVDYTEFPGHLRLLLPSAANDCVYVNLEGGISVACPPDEPCDECTITIKNAGLCDLGCNAYAWGPALYEYDEATGHETIRYIGSHRSEGAVAWEAVLQAGDRNGDSDFSQSADGTILAVYSPEGWVSMYALEPEGIERIHSVRLVAKDGTLAIREDAGVPDLVEQVGKSQAGEVGGNAGILTDKP